MNLDKEIAFFDANRTKFLDSHEGKFALVKNETCHGFFDTADSAYEEGIELFGFAAFLIRQVLEHDPINDAPAMMYGLLHATV